MNTIIVVFFLLFDHCILYIFYSLILFNFYLTRWVLLRIQSRFQGSSGQEEKAPCSETYKPLKSHKEPQKYKIYWNTWVPKKWARAANQGKNGIRSKHQSSLFPNLHLLFKSTDEPTLEALVCTSAAENIKTCLPNSVRILGTGNKSESSNE